MPDVATPGQIVSSPVPLGEVTRNVGAMLLANGDRLGASNAFAQRDGDDYRFWIWRELVDDVKAFAAFLAAQGLERGDRCAFVTQNGYERAVAELAVMASGLVSVPIFAGYPKAMMSQLLTFTKAKALVCDAPAQLEGLEPGARPALVVGLKWPGEGVTTFAAALAQGRATGGATRDVFLAVPAEALALVMFTSGTSGRPKGVMLTHRNLMSQQRALELLWKPRPGMRLLCYLPWHHSFGGLFERFFALHSGGCLAIDDSWGRDTKRLIANFKAIRPNVYFSVPKVYQELVAAVLADKDVEATVFNPELDFVFTAAAPLPLSASEVFRAHGVPVVEGWGLTETSPCCTLTERALERTPGVVGRPIPGVEVALVDDGEIVVRGPNVMQGYLDQPEATREVLDGDGWFHTGDLGEWTPGGLKILSRKDRMFKLSNGEKVFPAQLEETLRASCRYVKHSFVFGSGQPHPLALLFPSREMFQVKKDGAPADGTCECPSGDDSLAACLATCIHRFNQKATARFERIERAVVVCAEPSLESGELTPSFKLIPRAVEAKYRQHMRALEQHADDELPDDAIPVHPGQERKP
ncbi:MAG: AMP-binding protein [Myxococcaceae bacterium]